MGSSGGREPLESEMKQKELQRLINNALSSDNKTLLLTESQRSNPQVEELRRVAMGRVQAWEAMLEALQNDPMRLRIFAMD